MDALREFLFGPNGTRLDGFLDGLGSMLGAPGQLLIMMFSGSTSDEIYVERLGDFALPMGIGVWLLAAVAARVAWQAMRRPHEAQARIDDTKRAVGDEYRRVARSVTPGVRTVARLGSSPLAWGVVWRAQVVHLVLYLALPVLLFMAQATLFLMLFPFPWMVANRASASVSHLDSPVCWVFASYCRSPSYTIRYHTEDEVAQCQAGQCPPESDLLVDPDRWLWKASWAAITLAWIFWWRRRQRQRRKPPTST